MALLLNYVRTRKQQHEHFSTLDTDSDSRRYEKFKCFARNRTLSAPFFDQVGYSFVKFRIVSSNFSNDIKRGPRITSLLTVQT